MPYDGSYDQAVTGLNQRAKVRMSDPEVLEFLDECRERLNVATFNRDGTAHLVQVGYAFLDGKVMFETKVKSQKVVNLQRNSRITCLVADGREYSDFRGVQVVGRATIIDDLDLCCRIAINLMWRHSGIQCSDEDRPKLERMMNKRVAVLVEPKRLVSWDHRKL